VVDDVGSTVALLSLEDEGAAKSPILLTAVLRFTQNCLWTGVSVSASLTLVWVATVKLQVDKETSGS
jgi:hypothetical protein